MEWLNTTPLGAPLVPDVNAIMAGSELDGSNALSNSKPVAADSSSIDCSATAPEVLMMCARRASGSCGSIMTKGRPEIRVARMAGTDSAVGSRSTATGRAPCDPRRRSSRANASVRSSSSAKVIRSRGVTTATASCCIEVTRRHLDSIVSSMTA